MGYSDRKDFSVLVGKTLTAIHGGKDSDRLMFECSDGSEYVMLHNDDCCESVTTEDIAGDLSDLVGQEVIEAREDTNSDDPPESEWGPPESFTWTLYTIRTNRATVVIRWYGTSNGYYSEGVDFEETRPPTPDSEARQP